MTANEAYKKLLTVNPSLKIVKCSEYENLFVFESGPKNDSMLDSKDFLVGNLYSVNKKTGDVRYFTPLDIPIEDYHSGKRVLGYK